MTQLVPFYPGGSPCNGDCSLEWAAAEFQVDLGTPVPLTVPEGSIITHMSYARDGEPYVSGQSYITVTEHYGEGYVLEDGRIMFKFEECQNWSIVTADAPLPLPSETQDSFLTSWTPPQDSFLTSWDPPTWHPPVWDPPITEIPPTWEPPVVSQVSLADSSIYLLLALLFIWGIKRVVI